MKKHIDKSVSYNTYFKQHELFVKENKASGENQDQLLIDYTKLNYKRLKKWNKIYKPGEEILSKIKNHQNEETWIVLTESWCGDAAQLMAQFDKISSFNDKIDYKVLYRDENLELMDQYLTNGGRSIPKVLRIDNKTNKVISTWGPRPQEAIDIVKNHKENGTSYAEDLHLWYAKNKNVALEKEIIEFLK